MYFNDIYLSDTQLLLSEKMASEVGDEATVKLSQPSFTSRVFLSISQVNSFIFLLHQVCRVDKDAINIEGHRKGGGRHSLKGNLSKILSCKIVE